MHVYPCKRKWVCPYIHLTDSLILLVLLEVCIILFSAKHPLFTQLLKFGCSVLVIKWGNLHGPSIGAVLGFERAEGSVLLYVLEYVLSVHICCSVIWWIFLGPTQSPDFHCTRLVSWWSIEFCSFSFPLLETWLESAFWLHFIHILCFCSWKKLLGFHFFCRVLCWVVFFILMSVLCE